MGRLDDIIKRNKGTLEQLDVIQGNPVNPTTQNHFKRDPIRWGLILKVVGVFAIPAAVFIVIGLVAC